MTLLNASSQPIATGASFSDHIGKRDHDGDLLCNDPLPFLPADLHHRAPACRFSHRLVDRFLEIVCSPASYVEMRRKCVRPVKRRGPERGELRYLTSLADFREVARPCGMNAGSTPSRVDTWAMVTVVSLTMSRPTNCCNSATREDDSWARRW
jgi:hypothetical protein